MRTQRLVLLPLLLLGACASTSVGTPEEVADQVLADLDAGRVERAEERFAPIAADPAAREKAYPVLYDHAKLRYESGSYAAAADVLGFLAAHYPDATAVREARVYALFLERASLSLPDPDLHAELEAALLDARETSTPAPWLDLVEAQHAIDAEDLPTAREAFGRFRSRWNGTPAELGVYVDDLGYFLASH